MNRQHRLTQGFGQRLISLLPLRAAWTLALPLALPLALALAGTAQAQTAADTDPLTRSQVKMETREFLRTHHWNEDTSQWTLVTPTKGK